MKGWGPPASRTATPFSVIQTITMNVWTARKRPVPRKRAMPSAKRPTASGSRRRKLLRLRAEPRGGSRRRPDRGRGLPAAGPGRRTPRSLRAEPRGTSGRRPDSATALPLAPVLGQQVVEDVVDGDRADEPAEVVDHRRRAPGARRAGA